MKFNSCLLHVFLLNAVIKECTGNICMFYHLTADCRYRVDGISMVHIQARINQCNDPVDITFHLKSGNPEVTWQHTYIKQEEKVRVHGFDKTIFLNVRHGFRIGNKYTIQADFIVNGAATKFIREEIDLIQDNCMALTTEGMVAIAVLVPILVISIVLLLVVFIMWRRGVKQQKLRSSMLVDNSEPPGVSDPPVMYQNGHDTVTVGQSSEPLPDPLPSLDNEMQPDFSNIPGYNQHMRF